MKKTSHQPPYKTCVYRNDIENTTIVSILCKLVCFWANQKMNIIKVSDEPGVIFGPKEYAVTKPVGVTADSFSHHMFISPDFPGDFHEF